MRTWIGSPRRCKKHYDIKIRGRLGPDKKDDKEIRILNRCVKYTDSGIEYEADPRHAEIIIRELGLVDKSSVISTPGTKPIIGDPESEDKLSSAHATCYRKLVARANFMAQDRPDVQFAVK